MICRFLDCNVCNSTRINTSTGCDALGLYSKPHAEYANVAATTSASPITNVDTLVCSDDTKHVKTAQLHMEIDTAKHFRILPACNHERDDESAGRLKYDDDPDDVIVTLEKPTVPDLRAIAPIRAHQRDGNRKTRQLRVSKPYRVE